MSNRRNYKFRSWVFDSGMIVVTGGFWAVRIFVREIRKIAR